MWNGNLRKSVRNKRIDVGKAERIGVKISIVNYFKALSRKDGGLPLL
jgi:hypothetical protein